MSERPSAIRIEKLRTAYSAVAEWRDLFAEIDAQRTELYALEFKLKAAEMRVEDREFQERAFKFLNDKRVAEDAELETLRAENEQLRLTNSNNVANYQLQVEELRAESARLEAGVAHLQAARNELAQLNVSGVNLGELQAERWFTERLRNQLTALESRQKALLEACESAAKWFSDPHEESMHVRDLTARLRAAISAAKEKV